MAAGMNTRFACFCYFSCVVQSKLLSFLKFLLTFNQTESKYRHLYSIKYTKKMVSHKLYPPSQNFPKRKNLLSFQAFFYPFTCIVVQTLLLLLLLSRFSRVRLCATPWTAAYQAPPSMGFSRQEYWSGVPLPSPSHLDTTHTHKYIYNLIVCTALNCTYLPCSQLTLHQVSAVLHGQFNPPWIASFFFNA